MPRLPRLHVPGGCYHVILRGNHRENLFLRAEDRQVLNAIVAEAIDKYGARVHAFCWVSNHLQALIQIGEYPLGKLMQRIATRYSRYRHKRLRTTGHLFERRHRAWLVDADTYFIALLKTSVPEVTWSHLRRRWNSDLQSYDDVADRPITPPASPRLCCAPGELRCRMSEYLNIWRIPIRSLGAGRCR